MEKSKDAENELFVGLGILVAGIVTIICSGIIRAYTITCLWAWFIVPFGVVQIGLAWAFGISIIAALLTKDLSGSVAEKLKEGLMEHLAKTMFTCIFTNASLLLMSFIAHKLM